MPDDDLAGRGSSEPEDPRAELETAALAAAAAVEATPVAQDEAIASLDVGTAAAEVAVPVPPTQDPADASWSDLTAEAQALAAQARGTTATTPPHGDPLLPDAPAGPGEAPADPPAEAPPTSPPHGDPLVPDAAAAPVKKAPAKKAVAKKAPAKKAPAKTAKAPVKKAPAKKAPAKKAPAKKAPAKKVVGEVVAEPVPSSGLRVTPAEAAVVGAAAAVGAAAPAPPQGGMPTAVLRAGEPRRDVTVLPAGRGLSAGARALVTLMVVLLAGAAGLAAAAVVERGQETWRSSLTVRLIPGSGSPASLADAQRRYASRLPALTPAIAQSQDVPGDDVRSDVSAQVLGSDQLRVVAETATPSEAQALAIAGASALVDGVPRDQAATVTDPAARLSALISGYVTKPERTRPSDRLALLVGLAAGAAVLLLAGTLALVARGRAD